MDLNALENSLGISNEVAHTRATELMRMSYNKIPSFHENEICRPAACLFLACEEAGIVINAKNICRKSGGTAKSFNVCINSIRYLIKFVAALNM